LLADRLMIRFHTLKPMPSDYGMRIKINLSQIAYIYEQPTAPGLTFIAMPNGVQFQTPMTLDEFEASLLKAVN
jgi:hypothetical protein